MISQCTPEEKALGQKLYDDRCVTVEEFSRGTYNINVETEEEMNWVFMSFNEDNLSDSFCSCSSYTEHSSCEHLYAAYLTVFGSKSQPLHVHYEDSFWKQCALATYDDQLIHDIEKSNKENALVFTGDDIKKVLIRSNDIELIERIESMILDPEEITEENSIKLSGCSPDQIQAWRYGRANAALRLELSSWTDFWKECLSLCHTGRLKKAQLSGPKGKVPSTLEFTFDQFKLSLTLSIETLGSWLSVLAIDIPELKLVASESLELNSAAFIPAEQVWKLSYTSLIDNPLVSKAKKLAYEWLYHPDVGFINEKYITGHSLEIAGAQMDDFLTKNQSALKILTPELFQDDRTYDLHWNLNFDDSSALSVDFYIDEPGDLSQNHAFLLTNWAYIPSKGFILIDRKNWMPSYWQANVKIEKESVSQLVQRYHQLFDKEGWKLHIAPVGETVTYSVHDNGTLEFKIDWAYRGLSGLHEFGNLIYVPQEGFFPKGSVNEDISDTLLEFARRRLKIQSENVPSFITENYRNLVDLPSFFAQASFIDRYEVSLRIEEEVINCIVEPVWSDEIEVKNTYTYKHWVWAYGHGFLELPGFLIEFDETLYKRIAINERKYFIDQILPKLRPYINDVDPCLVIPETIELQLNESKLELPHCPEEALIYKTELGMIPFVDVIHGLLTEEQFLLTDAGLLDLHKGRFQWFYFIARESLIQGRFSLFELMKIDAFEPIMTADDTFNDWLANKVDVPELALESSKSKLRPYQQEGLQWMWRMYHYGLSVMLCDDMGLGKTHQAMALLQEVFNSKSESKNPSLILCPTSILYHWLDRLAKYCPQLKVACYYGQTRSMDEVMQSNIVLSTYGIWRRDYQVLNELNFELMILDEVQCAKTKKSLLYRSLKDVKARFRLGLTGTPVENYVHELKSLFDLILPGCLPQGRIWKKLFEDPINKRNDQKAKRALSRIISPFILRRTKENVLQDLPPKTEEIMRVDMSDAQKKIYLSLVENRAAPLLEEVQRNPEVVTYTHIFTLLSALKQVCNHPAVYYKEPDLYEKYSSGKWDCFTELMEEARRSGQKVVVFSQYLDMIEIIRQYLEGQCVDYALLTGKMRNRHKQIERFQMDPSCEVFISSLHAGGLGIDLTAASVVIHYDRWWNPAKEDQATDRVHRIGQKRGTQVFKLVTRNSIEDRIDQILSQKRVLMKDLLWFSNQEGAPKFSQDDFVEILQMLVKDAVTLK